MSEQPSATPESIAQIRSSLHDLAALLREARHLDAEAQRSLAGLLDQLGDELDPAALPTPQTAHLAETATHLARALHELQHAGMVTGVKSRLEEAACRAENEAPVALGVIRRLIDSLANMGI